MLGRIRLTRRQFLKRAGGGALLAGGGTLGYAWRIEPHWVQVVRRDLEIGHLPESLVGRTLVQISDLHVGEVVDEAYMTRTMQRVSGIGADIIAITGDFMTYASDETITAVLRVLGNLRPAALATVGVFGNHDYSRNWSRVDVADELASGLGKLGIRILRNAVTDVGGLQIAGIDDFWSPNFAPHLVMPRIDSTRAALVLCHNPDAADLAVWSGYKGWILSGHTHGGQCCVPFLGPPLLPVENRRYTSGAFDLHDGRWMYINRGLGYLRRVRFHARPEITVFTLRRAEATSHG